MNLFKHFSFRLKLMTHVKVSRRKLTVQHVPYQMYDTEAATGGVLQKKVFLEISENSQVNTCARVSFLIKFRRHASVSLLKKRLWNRCFPVNFAKFSRTPFLQKTSERLLLMVPYQMYDMVQCNTKKNFIEISLTVFISQKTVLVSKLNKKSFLKNANSSLIKLNLLSEADFRRCF